MEDGMPRRKTMLELREIIRRLKLKQSIREIHRETGTHRTIIRKLRDQARDRGWLTTDAELPAEFEIQTILNGEKEEKDRRHPLDAFALEIKRWAAAGYTFVVMQRLLRERHECDESTIRRYVRRNYPITRRPVSRRDTRPGEVMEVDFGLLGRVYDPDSGRVRNAYVFSGRLRHSRRAYREVVFDQKQDTFFQCHIRAFEFFGGVPLKVVPDNLKAAIIKASYHDPLVNRAYRMLAEHYGFTISPTLPYTPRHKGGVENDIKFIKNNFWPCFKEKELAKGRDIPCSDDINKELDAWTREVDERIVRGVGTSPLDLFDLEEKNALRNLPEKRWDPVVWKKHKVQVDWRVQVDNAWYSVPYRHIGAEVYVCLQASIVRIFRDYKEIACHKRAIRKYQKVIRDEHAPPNQQEYLNTNSQGLLQKAAGQGESVRRVTEIIFADRAVDGFRPVRALLALSGKYGTARLNAACDRALEFRTASYTSVKKILQNELDIKEENRAANRENQTCFRFSRDIGFFDPDNYDNNGGTHE